MDSSYLWGHRLVHLRNALNRVEWRKSFVYQETTFVESDGAAPCIECRVDSVPMAMRSAGVTRSPWQCQLVVVNDIPQANLPGAPVLHVFFHPSRTMFHREAASRRNRALRKIRACRSVPLETRAVLEAIVDLIDRASGYTVAWPTARTIGNRIGRSERTVRWHLRAIRRTGIFYVHYLKPDEAVAWCQRVHGFSPNLERVRRQAPPLYEVSPDHWIWSTKRLTPGQDKELGEVVSHILALRNRHKPRRRMSVAARECLPAVSADHNPRDLEMVRRHLLALRVSGEAAIEMPVEEGDSEDTFEFEGFEPPVVDDLEEDVVSTSQEAVF